MTRLLPLLLLILFAVPALGQAPSVDPEEAQYQQDVKDSEKEYVKSKFSCILKDGKWQPHRNATRGSTLTQMKNAISQPIRWNALVSVGALTNVNEFMDVMGASVNDRGPCRPYPKTREGVEQAKKDMEQLNRVGKIWVDKGILPR